MVDLISRSKVMMKLKYTGDKTHDDIISSVRAMVRNEHPANYVQVVRCKDCQHCRHTPDMLICRVNALSSRPVSEEFFCGFGEEVKNV